MRIEVFSRDFETRIGDFDNWADLHTFQMNHPESIWIDQITVNGLTFPDFGALFDAKVMTVAETLRTEGSDQVRMDAVCKRMFGMPWKDLVTVEKIETMEMVSACRRCLPDIERIDMQLFYPI